MTGPTRVGVDATSWLNRRGFGRFARNAITRLVELDRERTYVLLMDEHDAGVAAVPAAAERRQVKLRRTEGGSNRGAFDLLRLTLAARRAHLDAFLFPSIYTYFPVPRVATIVGLHDTTAEEFPELALARRRDRILWRAKQHLALREAACLFTVSEAAREALARRFGIDPDLLPVVPEAPDPVFHRRAAGESHAALTRLGLEPGAPYFLYSGGINPHKNVETLLAAYAMLVARGDPPPLVLVGELESDPYVSAARAVREQISVLGIAGRVHLPGYVSDDELACLYSSATAFVSPSRSEGFGLPAVEAAACGAPVVLSDLPAHRETMGNAALFFPPLDAEALVAQLALVLEDGELRRSLAARGRTAVAGFSWDAAAERLRELVNRVAKPAAGARK